MITKDIPNPIEPETSIPQPQTDPRAIVSFHCIFVWLKFYKAMCILKYLNSKRRKHFYHLFTV